MAQSPFVVEVRQENFREVVLEGSQRQPVLVDFWADWCQPCKMLMPVLQKLAEEYGGAFLLAKVNTDLEQSIAGYFQVRSLPTVMLFKEGRVVDQFAGVQPESAVRALLDRHVAKPGAASEEAARAAEADGRLDEALALYQQALQAAPAERRLIIDLARVLASQGELDQSERLLDQLPAELRDEPEARGLRARFRYIRQLPELPAAEVLTQRMVADPGDSEAAYQLAIHAIAAGDYGRFAELLFGLTRRDRGYGEDAARRTLLELFDLLGPEHPLTRDYRRRLFAAMY